MNEGMAHVIDWNLSQAEFRRQVREIIRKAEKNGKVLPLPIKIKPGQVMLDLMTLLLAQVNCDNCDAPCCRHNPNDAPISLLPPEYQRLADKYGAELFVLEEDQHALPMPCPFLKQGRCSIYPDRPLVCVIYPFQTGANDGEGGPVLAMASNCPEAKRITRNTYMTAWRIRRQYQLLGEYNFMKGIL